jgi:hypothetical protein
MASFERARTSKADLAQPADFVAITVRAGTAAVHAPLAAPERLLGRAGGSEAA